jgi:hypothetical protein
MISLPPSFVGDVSSTSSSVIAGLNPYTTLIIGVLLAALVISILIGAIHHK